MRSGPERMALLRKHLAFVRRLVEEKKLRLAGPFADEGKVFGMAIVAASSLEEATTWLDEDPAVQAGVYGQEVHPGALPGAGGNANPVLSGGLRGAGKGVRSPLRGADLGAP